jgi:hypothetical protein
LIPDDPQDEFDDANVILFSQETTSSLFNVV